MKIRFLITALLILAFLGSMPQFARAATSTVTNLVPTADTYVDSSRSTTNLGSSTLVWIDASSPTRRALLRFSLSSIPAGSTITSAVLKLYVTSDGSSVAGTVKSVSGSWSEATVTYATAPAVGSSIATIPGPATPSTSVSVNITSFVVGKSTINLYITSSSTDGVQYYSREKGSSLAPRLQVTWSPRVTATATRSATSMPTSTRTPNLTPTSVASPTRTTTPTATATKSGVPTSTASSTATMGFTASPTPTSTRAPTSSPTATSTPDSGSLAIPLRLAFYYDSFPESWGTGSAYPYTNYTPTLGFYDSSDASIVKQHIKAMQYGHIQGGIVFWPGASTPSDNRFSGLLAAASGTGFRWALYYMPEAWSDPSLEGIASDLAYIFNKYAQDPSYLHIAGKPVLFVYAGATDVDCGMADRWKAANALGFYVVLKVFSGYPNCANQPDNWHQYGPAVDYDAQGSHSVSISPGYWIKGASAALPRDLARWYQNIRNMIAAKTDFQLITTWNGWTEGTQVESSNEMGTLYLDALHDDGADPTVMAAGDIVCPDLVTTDTTCQQMATSQLIVNQQPDAVLQLGDLCQSTSVDCFYNYYDPSWGRLFSISHPITGNHEYGKTAAQYFFDYWNGIGVTGGRAGDRGKGYYSFEIGTWHVIALNSQCEYIGGCDLGSPEYTWLQQDLANHPGQCTLTYMHKPLFGSTSLVSAEVKPLWTLLYEYNADLVLDGHSHTYERFAPQDPNGIADPLRGIREIIAGTGGAFHTGIGTIAANSEVRNAVTYGALKVTLHPGSYDWQFSPIAGQTFTDSGTTLCH